jgi:arylsulfatase
MPAAAQQQKRPNIVMLMTDDTDWNDFGANSGGGAALGHPHQTSTVSPRRARRSPVGTVKQAARQRASFMAGRIPIRAALSIVVVPGDENALKKKTPAIAEFFSKNGYSTYFSGKWHLGDRPVFRRGIRTPFSG